jgi:malate dehydrogenase
MGVISDGSHYDIPAGLVFGFPIVCENGKYRIIDNVPVSNESRKRLDITRDELLAERKAVEDLL